jgi:hypothetical protein
VSVILSSCLLFLLDVEDGDAVLHTLTQGDLNIPTATANYIKQSPRFTFDTTNTMSMSYNSKVDNFLVRDVYEGNVNGNLKYQETTLCPRRLSQSDPDLLKSLRINQTCDKSHSVSNLKRQNTWHKLIYPSPSDKVLPDKSDQMVIQKISSTV